MTAFLSEGKVTFGGIQKLTLLDYPQKLACVLFTCGCNFRCPFCHNASLVFEKEAPLAEEEIFSFLQKRRGVLDGVCISGGEPLLQPGLPAFIQRVKEMGYLVKLDTNGSFPDRLRFLLKQNWIDLVAMDIKADREGYAKSIGLPLAPLAKLEESLFLLKESQIPYELRTTMVKPLHTRETFMHIASWLQGANAYALQKFEQRDSLICGEGLTAFSLQEALLIQKEMQKTIPNCFLRGYA